MYSLPAYGQMVADRVRFDAYRSALEHAVNADSVVADLGAGPGVFALLAAKAGARKVYAVESDAVLEWLRPLARDNGLEDKIEIIRGRSVEVELGQTVDVLVSDLRGVLPFFGRGLPSLIDARDRWLKVDGRLIPQADTLWACPVSAPFWYQRQVGAFEPGALGQEVELDLSQLHRAASNHWCRADLKPEACRSSSECLGRLAYPQLTSAHFQATAEWQLTAGTVHGLAIWFDSDLDSSTTITNRPSMDSPLYGQAFFPWRVPIEARSGERLEVKFEARLVGEDYVFRWRGRHYDRRGRLLELQDQSTFFGAPLGLADVHATPLGG